MHRPDFPQISFNRTIHSKYIGGKGQSPPTVNIGWCLFLVQIADRSLNFLGPLSIFAFLLDNENGIHKEIGLLPLSNNLVLFGHGGGNIILCIAKLFEAVHPGGQVEIQLFQSATVRTGALLFV